MICVCLLTCLQSEILIKCHTSQYCDSFYYYVSAAFQWRKSESHVLWHCWCMRYPKLILECHGFHLQKGRNLSQSSKIKILTQPNAVPLVKTFWRKLSARRNLTVTNCLNKVIKYLYIYTCTLNYMTFNFNYLTKIHLAYLSSVHSTHTPTFNYYILARETELRERTRNRLDLKQQSLL